MAHSKHLWHVLIGSTLLASAPLAPVLADEDVFTDALQSAYETNPRIQSQRRALEQVNENVSQAIAAFRPSVSATYQNGRQRLSFGGSSMDHSDVENRSVTLTQPLFLGGSNIFNYQAAKDRMRAARHQLQQTEQEVVLDAIVAYMDVVRDYQVHELSVNNHNVLARQLKAARDRFSVGDVTRTDVAQSESRSARADADVIQAKGDLESSLASFERVVGFRPENLPLPFPKKLPTLPRNLEEATQKALERNPSVLATHYAKDAAEDDTNAAIGNILPQVSIQGSMSREDGAGVTGGNKFDQDRILLNVTLPIYQNGSEYSQVRSSELAAKQREFEAQDAREEAKEAVEQAWEAMETARSIITAQQVQVASADTALDGVMREHQYGTRTVLDVLDAKQEVFSANVQLTRAKRDYMVALYNLLLVMGTLDVQTLGLNTPAYDADEHYDSVKWQLIGF